MSFDIDALMKMQTQMQQIQEEASKETAEASAGGGMVTVVVTGDLRVTSVTIDPEAVDPEDVDMLADMVTAAVNEALRAAQELAGSRMGGATEGLDLGGLGVHRMPAPGPGVRGRCHGRAVRQPKLAAVHGQPAARSVGRHDGPQ